MSGTSYCGVVLHVAPESTVGGPLGLVRRGDLIRLDVRSRTLDLQVDAAEPAERRALWEPSARKDERGFRKPHCEHEPQANHCCEVDFVRGRSAVVSDAATSL